MVEAPHLRSALDLIHHSNQGIEQVRLLVHLGLFKRRRDHCVDGFAPFSSLATRETFLDINDNVAMAPGPGYYDPKPSKKRNAITGTGNMNSRVINLLDIVAL